MSDDGAVDVTAATLRRWPLPTPDGDADKDSRGQVVVVGGSAVTPGAVILAGVAALRAGAGKLSIVTTTSTAAAVAVAVPEALVSGLAETPDGAIDPDDVDPLRRALRDAAAVLVGTGALDTDATAALVERVFDGADDDATIVLDAAAVTGLDTSRSLGARVVVMPNESEAARLLGDGHDGDDVRTAAGALAERLGCVAAVRAADSCVTAPGCDAYVDHSGNAGLATSGSGDVLAGILSGLAARGADPLQAAVWAVHAHGLAGERLAARVGPVGYLARELLDEVPSVLTALSAAG